MKKTEANKADSANTAHRDTTMLLRSRTCSRRDVLFEHRWTSDNKSQVGSLVLEFLGQ